VIHDTAAGPTRPQKWMRQEPGEAKKK
jgi:hypothetical protein